MSSARKAFPSSSTSRIPRRHGVRYSDETSNTGPSDAAGVSSAAPSAVPAPAPASTSSRLRVKRLPLSSTSCSSASSSSGCVVLYASSAARAAARAARSASASRADPLPDHAAGRDQQDDGDEPGDEPFGHRPHMAERPAAAIVGVLGVLHVADDRVELVVADLLLGE